MNIERTLFWFKDKREMILVFNEQFFGLAVLLNRLLNERYNGPKIKFINIDFLSKETYEMFPNIPMNNIHYYSKGGGHLQYYGVIDYSEFGGLSWEMQNEFIWKKAYEYLLIASKKINNDNLLRASEYAYKRGIEIRLNTDYKVVESNVFIFGQSIKASIWINFNKDEMVSKLNLEKEGITIFQKQIDRSKNGVEFFLEMYKNIEVEGNIIVIKGRKDVDYLPLRIPIEKLEM